MQSQTKKLGTFDIVKEIYHNEGAMAFYKGTMSPLAGVAAIISVQFATNEIMKRFFITVNS